MRGAIGGMSSRGNLCGSICRLFIFLVVERTRRLLGGQGIKRAGWLEGDECHRRRRGEGGLYKTRFGGDGGWRKRGAEGTAGKGKARGHAHARTSEFAARKSQWQAEVLCVLRTFSLPNSATRAYSMTSGSFFGLPPACSHSCPQALAGVTRTRASQWQRCRRCVVGCETCRRRRFHVINTRREP